MLPESPRRIQRGSHHELPLAEDVVVSKEPKTPPFESSQGAIPPALLAQTPHAPDRNCRPAYSVPNTPTQLWSLPMAVPQTTKASTTFDLSPPINETFKAHSQAAQYLAIGDSAGNSATPSSQGSQSWATDLIASLPVPEPPRRLRSPINLSLPSSPVPSGVFSSPESPIASCFTAVPPSQRFPSLPFRSHRRSQSALSTFGQPPRSRPRGGQLERAPKQSWLSSGKNREEVTKRRKTVSFVDRV